MKFSKYHLATDELGEYGMPHKRIVFSTRTATSVLLSESIYEQLLENDFEKIEESIYKSLIEKEFIVSAEQDEFSYFALENKKAKEKVNFLAITIQPSADCQLGCYYCGQTHTKHYATKELLEKYVERIKHLLKQKPDLYSGIALTWYGGEPLTNFSAILKTSESLIELCRENSFTYLSDIVTNGLNLKPDLFEKLVKQCGIRDFQITVDGMPESHDKRRYSKSGKPTFDIIMRNIMNVVNTETYNNEKCNITIRINIDKTNYQYVDPFIDYVKKCNLEGKVALYFATIVNFGGNDAGKDSLTREFFAQKEIEWLLKCYEYGIDIFKILPKRTFYACMAEKEDSEVWDAFGNIYSCWEFPYSDTYGKGESLIGNLFESEETYRRNATLRDWNNLLISGKVNCNKCLLFPICAGMCPKMWYEGTPACPPFKSNFKEKLLLDYYIRQKRKQNAGI
jgi:uncharacterized protein